MKILGLSIFSISFVNTLIIVFAYRDVSLPLILMFLITLVGLPLGTYLIHEKVLSENNFEPDSDDLEVKGLFTLGYENR